MLTPASRRRGRLRLATALAAAGAALAVGAAAVPAAGAAALTPIPCGKGVASGLTCARLAVPIDRSGAVSGAISLYVERGAAVAGSTVALVPLVGGPGQAATDFTGGLRTALAAGAGARTIAAFDQRGTGRSGPIKCPALDKANSASDYAEAAGGCARTIGPGANRYATRDTVADLEDLRIALGVTKLALYGVSYGTKVALAYAAAHPANVDSLVLDSVVDPAENDLFDGVTYRAMSRVLTTLCARGACRGVTDAPVRNVATLVKRLRTKPIRGAAISATGRRLTGPLTVSELYSVLLAGDLDQSLRGELPGAVVAAGRGDADPLLRLLIRGGDSESFATPRSPIGQATASGTNNAVFIATSCEEIAVPWGRGTPVGQRRRASASAIARKTPQAAFAPFDRSQPLESPLIQGCAGWPNAAEAPVLATGSVGAAPTLVLEGEGDLRTPVEGAREVVARMAPGATFVTVPGGGHSVLGTDRSKCASTRVAAFYTGQPILPCPALPVRRVAPVPPASFARVRAVKGLSAQVGRTLNAFSLTFSDGLRQAAAGRVRGGGLRGGRFTVSRTALQLIGYEYVRGVRVNGSYPSGGGTATFTISGPAAAPGRITVTRSGAVSGSIGGRKVKGKFGSSSDSAAFAGLADGFAPAPRPAPWAAG